MYWLIGFDNQGNSRLGSNYSWKIDLKSVRGARNRAELMLKSNNNIESIYRISDIQYNQKVCEMDKIEFNKHIKRIGLLVATK